jgi:hypothetical protein
VAVTTAPTGPAYSVVLIAHVLCAVVGFGAIGLTGAQAWRARLGPDAPSAESVRRYFRPGTNWAARLLYGVPVFGFVLLAMSKGAFDARDAWVTAGLLIWLTAALTAEMVVWPGERAIQEALGRSGNGAGVGGSDHGADKGEGGAGETDGRVSGSGSGSGGGAGEDGTVPGPSQAAPDPGPPLERTCRHVALAAAALAVCFLAATVLMVGKP